MRILAVNLSSNDKERSQALAALSTGKKIRETCEELGVERACNIAQQGNPVKQWKKSEENEGCYEISKELQKCARKTFF